MEAERDRLAVLKRRTYSAALILTLAVITLAWLTRAPGDGYRDVTAPAFGVLLAGLLLALASGRFAMRRIESLMVVVFLCMPLSRQLWLFHFAGPPDEEWLRFLGNSYWASSALIVAVATICERRRGLLIGGAILMACVLVAVTGVAHRWIAGDMTGDTIGYVVGALIFLALFLLLMSAVTVMRDQWQRALVRAEQYSRRAMTDMLTGLANRHAGDEALTRHCANARRHGLELSVIVGDLDHFKAINDSAGHATGDAVLVEVGERLRAIVRKGDLVARWGGEEFLVIAPETDLEGAARLAERCRRALARAPIAGIDVTMTFGVAQHVPGDTKESLVARADDHLYAGKGANGNRVQATAGTAAEAYDSADRGLSPNSAAE